MAAERVLIVDDSDQAVGFITDNVLKPNNFQPFIAKDGEAGLKMALAQHPDLILLDTDVAKMNGLAVLNALNARNVNIPVIFMTAQGSETSAVQAFRMGVKDYILKPFEAPAMLDAIKRALRETHLLRERDELTQRLLKSNQEAEQRLRELTTLLGIGKTVTSWLDQDRLLVRLVEAAIYLTGAEEGSLLLVDNKTNELYMVAARGLDERVARSIRLPVQDSLAGKVVTTGQPLILSGEDFTKIKTAYQVRSLMYVPLKVKERVSGVLGVNYRQAKRDFTNHDLRLLSALADYSAISLENTRLFNQAESERAKLVAILSEIEEPVVVINDDGQRIVVANAAFCRTFDLDEDEVEGHLLTELIYNRALFELLGITPESGYHHKGEISLNDGRTFYGTLSPIPGVGRAIVMQDVTHFKKLEHIKSDFVSTVSHDLHAPLNSIKAYAQLLSPAGRLNEKQQLFVDRITRGAEQVTALIDNVLDLSAIDAGIDPDITVVNLGQLTIEAVADFQDQADHKRQQLICHIVGDLTPVAGNVLRLRQVVDNLIDNALKYTPPKGQISVIVLPKDKQVIFRIEDNGLGIPPSDLPFVFDKFYRVKDHGQAESPGAGLGLAICKSIVEKYGGYIRAENKPDQGTIFTFTLPLASTAANDHPNSPTF
jgi:two-component system NtrC family sensor kinase